MKKILIVDDNPDIVNLVKVRLEANHYQALAAYDGEEALKVVAQQKPDLMIVDIIMPKVDGYNFVKEIKSNKETREIPIIILTAKEKMKDLFAIEGVADYIIKPFKDEELIGKIKTLLGESQP